MARFQNLLKRYQEIISNDEIRNNNALWVLSEDDIHLSELIQTIKRYILTKFPLQWENKIVLPDNQIITDDLENTIVYAFDWKPIFSPKGEKINLLRLCFVSNNISNANAENESKDPLIFASYSNNKNPDIAYYIPDFSNHNINDNKRFGTLVFNFHYFMKKFQEHNNPELLFDEIEETVFHEIRHYYDNLLGIYDPDSTVGNIVNLELWANECLDLNEDIVHNETTAITYNDSTYEIDFINRFCYLNTPTELNAYANSFDRLINQYIRQHTKRFTLRKLFKHISDNRYEEFPYDIFVSYSIYQDYKSFKKYIDSIIDEPLTSYFYLFIQLKHILNLSPTEMEKFNQLIETKYFNPNQNDITLDEIADELPIVFLKFMDNEFIPYIYNIIQENYKNTFYNMCISIDKAIKKYIK